MSKIKLYILFLLITFIISIKSYSQDAHFTQFYATPLYTCPAFAGSVIGTRAILNFRDQWPAIPGAFVTTAFSIDHYLHNMNSGIGLLFFRDRAGSGRLGTTSVSLQYTYDIRVSRMIHVRPAIQFSYGQRSIDFFKLRFNDQLYYEMGASTEVPTFESISYPDLGIGFLAYSEIYWGGFSYDHLTEPNHSLVGGYIVLQKKFTMFGGYKHLLSGRIGTDNEESLTANFLFRSQSKYDQFDLGAYWNRKPLIVGIWYRGIPLFKAYKRGYQNNDSFAVLAGYQLDDVKFGLSYDFTISRLALNTGGAIEISIIYEFNKTLKRKRKSIIIPCPKF